MKSLIIAEKPSLGRNIIRAIGNSRFKSFDGYAESSEYIVTWGFGHLFSLYDIEEYGGNNLEESSSWSLEGLPFKPDEFKFSLRKKPKSKSIDSGVKKQFVIIKKLCARDDVDCVINAGDADREGEIIIRIILDQANNKKPAKRLWLPEQTDESIRAALKNLKSSQDYINLANEGYARTYIDWLYGINLTRLASVKSGSLMRVGRVIVPIVKAIYDRDMAIRNFVPEPYIVIVSKEKTKGQEITLKSKKTFSDNERADAQKLCDLYNSQQAVVTDIKAEKKEVAAGRLFSLSKLQGYLGKKYKMKPKESLALVQKLYEGGYVTYPRTNTEYLASAESGRINGILAQFQNLGYSVKPKDNNKKIYDDSKIESHSALTPTLKIAKQQNLTEAEWKVYSTIFDRFVAVFCSEPCMVNKTTVTVCVGDLERFNVTGETLLSKGWMEYEFINRSDKYLPQLNIGDQINISFSPMAKETQPPKHYTSETFLNFLKNPFREEKLSLREEDTDTEIVASEGEDNDYAAMFDGVELGTEATRTSIIENAIHSNYISLKNDIYSIEPNGIFYIEALEKLGLCLSKEKTAQIGKLLKQVYRGEVDMQKSVELAFFEIQTLFNGTKGMVICNTAPTKQNTIAIGVCPNCGGNIIKNKFGNYSCDNWKNGCRYTIYKDVSGKNLTEANVRDLLSKGYTREISGFKSKAGKAFSAKLTLDENGKVKFLFPNRNN